MVLSSFLLRFYWSKPFEDITFRSIAIEKRAYTNIGYKDPDLKYMKIFDFGSASTCLEPVFYADSKSAIRFEISLSVQKLCLTDKSTQICQLDFFL